MALNFTEKTTGFHDGEQLWLLVPRPLIALCFGTCSPYLEHFLLPASLLLAHGYCPFKFPLISSSKLSWNYFLYICTILSIYVYCSVHVIVWVYDVS